jgi:integrase
MSNFIEGVLDDEFQNFRPIIRKVENPIKQATRKKTVLSESQVDALLQKLVEQKQYEKACCFALAAFSGRRKSELLRFKVSYFTEDNIIYGSLYKSPEEMKTKGRGLGKFIPVYVLAKKFNPYFELWMNQRRELGIESEWLFPSDADPKNQLNDDRLNSWALTFSKLLNVDFYWHSLRHYFTTQLCRSGLPDSVIVSILGWDSPSMISIYRDIPADEEFGKYFDENGIKTVEKTKLSDL